MYSIHVHIENFNIYYVWAGGDGDGGCFITFHDSFAHTLSVQLQYLSLIKQGRFRR